MKKKLYQSYPEISGVEMASNDAVYEVTFENVPSLKSITLEDGDICEEDLVLTKDEVMRIASGVVVRGYGKHSGRKVWQLPNAIQKQIRKSCFKQTVV